MSKVVCPTLISVFGSARAAEGFLKDCLKGYVLRTRNTSGYTSCGVYEKLIHQLINGTTCLDSVGMQYPHETGLFIDIAQRWIEGDKSVQTDLFLNWIDGGFQEEWEEVKDYPNTGYSVQDIAPVLVDVVDGQPCPDTYCKFLWAIEGQYYKDEDSWDYEYASLWDALLFDGKMEKDELSGEYFIPDLGARVPLEGKSFEQHSKDVAERHQGGDVLLFIQWSVDRWLAAEEGELRYYDMVVPLVGGEPQWHEWSFAPMFKGCNIIPISKFLSGDYEVSLEPQEPPIRSKFLARAKESCYKNGKKMKLVA